MVGTGSGNSPRDGPLAIEELRSMKGAEVSSVGMGDVEEKKPAQETDG